MTDSRNDTESSRSPSSRGGSDKSAANDEAKKHESSGSSSPNSCRVYTLQELTAMKESPLSQQWPKYLDETFKNHRGFWDPEKWFQSFLGGAEEKIRSAAERPVSGFSNPREPVKKRDPKERIKSDQNDIVLSPQRGSFTTGCQVSTANGVVNSNGEVKKDDISLRPDTSRRVGSGRILARDRDIDDLERDNGGRRYERREDRYEPRGFRRDFGSVQDDRSNRRVETEGHDSRAHREHLEKPKRERDDIRGGRNTGGEGWYSRREERDDFSHGSRRGHGEQRAGPYGEDRNFRRRHGDPGHWKHENDEPEWMSATVDQNELMELRGFEDSPEKDDPDPLQKFKLEMKEKESKLRKAKSEELGEAAKRMTAKNESDNLTNEGQEFDIEDFLKVAVIPGFSNMLNDEAIDLNIGQPEATGGRFSQFFRPSNQSTIEPNKAAAAPSVRIPSPGDPSAYFAPISPAAKTTNEPQNSNSILNMLMVNSQGSLLLGNASCQNPVAVAPEGSVHSLAELRDKMAHSVEEVEADIKHNLNIQDGLPHLPHVLDQLKQHPSQIEMSPFEKFAALVGGKTEPHPPTLPSTNIVIPSVEVGRRSLIKPSPIPANAPTEQEILAGMIGPKSSAPPMGGNLRHMHQMGLHQLTMPELLIAIYNAPFNPEALKRPEAQALQAALNSNHVKLEVLVEHLATGNMPSLQREILLNVLKLAQKQGRLGPFPSPHQGRIPHPRHLMPSPLQQENTGFLQHLKFQQQHAQPSANPSGHLIATSQNQRGQSPFNNLLQDMNVHNHQFFQNALIKKKREEEKLRLRQVDSQAESSKVRSTDSPLTFTPTAVMKKIAAERRDSDPAFSKFQVSENKVSKGGGSDVIDSGHFSFPRSSPFSHGESAPLVHQSQFGSDAAQLQNQVLALQQQQLAFQAKQTMQRGPFPSVLESQRMYALQNPRLFQPMGQTQSIRIGEGIQQQPIVQQQLSQPSGLLQFFSPEVLAQAGSFPQLPPLPTQKVLTLEELERQSSAVAIQ